MWINLWINMGKHHACKPYVSQPLYKNKRGVWGEIKKVIFTTENNPQKV